MLRLHKQSDVCNVRNCYLFFEVPASVHECVVCVCVCECVYLLSVSATVAVTAIPIATAPSTHTHAVTLAAHTTCCQFAIRRRICQIYRVIISKNGTRQRDPLNAAPKCNKEFPNRAPNSIPPAPCPPSPCIYSTKPLLDMQIL